MDSFKKKVLRIALPVTAQSLLQSSFAIVDQMMIGKMGGGAIAAVGLGGNYSLIVFAVIGAAGTIGSILMAQYVGAFDEREAFRCMNVTAAIGTLLCGLLGAAAFLLPETILKFYTEDSAIIAEGVLYFKLIAFSFIPMFLCSAIGMWLRCHDRAIVSLWASLVGVVVNTALNYCLIFGHFGFPQMGIQGAGLATFVSQVVNFVLVLLGMVVALRKKKMRYLFSFRIQKKLTGFLWMMAPVLLGEVLWSAGQNVYSSFYGHISSNSLSAYVLTAPIQGLFTGVLSGISAASGVLVGKELGQNHLEEAYRTAKKMLGAGLWLSLILSGLLLLGAKPYAAYYPVEKEITYLTQMLLIIYACYAPVKMTNMIMGNGILRCGGDTKTFMLIDVLGTWLLGVPLCFLASRVWNLPILPVYSILSLEEIVRMLVCIRFFQKKKWMHCLTE